MQANVRLRLQGPKSLTGRRATLAIIYFSQQPITPSQGIGTINTNSPPSGEDTLIAFLPAADFDAVSLDGRAVLGRLPPAPQAGLSGWRLIEVADVVIAALAERSRTIHEVGPAGAVHAPGGSPCRRIRWCSP
jgi:hypothetical protein